MVRNLKRLVAEKVKGCVDGPDALRGLALEVSLSTIISDATY